MKFGFKTRVWGNKITNLECVLDVISGSGFEGVEITQRPECLGGISIEDLWKQLRERKLSLLTLTCGTLIERLTFLGNNSTEYFYIKHWDLDKINEILIKGFVPALHPGLFMPVRRVDDALQLLDKYPDLKLILDTAHLTIVGEDPIISIKNCFDHLVAVHLQDWTPEYGRLGPRFGRGFTELGEGIVKLDTVIEELQKTDYSGWVILEIDTPSKDPLHSVLACQEWLVKNGLSKKKTEIQRNYFSSTKASVDLKRKIISPEAEVKFREMLLEAAIGEVDSFYATVAAAFNLLIPSRLIMIWMCSPSQNQMGLMYSTEQLNLKEDRNYIVNHQEVLTGITLDRQAPVTVFNLTQKQPGEPFGILRRKFEYPELIQRLSLSQMVSIPIYNSNNQNYIRYVVNLFPEEPIEVNEDEFTSIGKAVTFAANAMLDKRCTSASIRVGLLADTGGSTEVFLEKLKGLIQEKLNCEAVAIFLVNEGEDKLEIAETTGTNWRVSKEDRYYKKGEGFTGTVWKKNESILTIDSHEGLGHKGKSEDNVRLHHAHARLWVPLVDPGGKVVSVVRCRNKQYNSHNMHPNMFTEDDIAVLDSIGQAAIPHLLILLDKKRRTQGLGRLTHELKTPLVAIRSAADFMMRTKGVEQVFEYDYPGDVWSWSELMRRLLSNADWYRYSSGGLPLQPSPTLLMKDVIAPAVKQVKILIREHGFSTRNIRYGNFTEIPRLMIDRNQFQQVMFNLLSNSIKHCYKDPKSFQVEISGVKIGNEFQLWFRDWGPGIKPELKEMIFEEGFRTSEAINRSVTGQGLGLWVVRQVIEAHDGKIEVTNCHLPTEFTIFLPEYLSDNPPLMKQDRRKEK